MIVELMNLALTAALFGWVVRHPATVALKASDLLTPIVREVPPATAAAVPVLRVAATILGGTECITCHRNVARYTPTPEGPVCANCKPIV